MKARFILSREKAIEQYYKIKELGVKVSYSYKTNKKVGKVLEKECDDCEFAVHNLSEVEDFPSNKRNKLWFFSQAWSNEDIKKLMEWGVRNFVIDNEADLNVLLNFLEKEKTVVSLLLRMRFQEHRINSGKYFTYGLSARRVNEIINEIKDNDKIDRLGIHIHRKSQNASEWEIKSELEDSLSEEVLKRINIINLGGGLPIRYRTYTSGILPYIFGKIREVKEWLENKKLSINVLDNRDAEIYVEPGRFIAGPAVKLETEVLQIYNLVIVVNASIYNCALDSVITDIRLFVDGELEDGDKNGVYYKIKGNTPTRDDIFRYRVKLGKELKVGDKIIFLNAGAYNYHSEFCDLEKLETIIV